ncbi:MAG TPA: signal peptidase I [Beijerinckiaceae bacterium]|nr:signal peptidase I [Beijerinckiaceae bacterium]
MTDPARLEDSKVQQKKKTRAEEGGIWETIKVIVQALLIALVVRTFLFQPFNIPSGSMIPTLLIGDYLFVSKYSYGYSRYSFPFGLPLFKGRIFGSPPKRGDVAVFKLPSDDSTDYIKRVIGLPGDKIQMKLGRLYINGAIVPREPIKRIVTRDAYGHLVKVPTYKETLPGGVSHTIIQLDGDTGFYGNTGVYVVPPNDYFMMGDNRDNSTDSRVAPQDGGVGFVPRVNFVGRSEILFFSVKGGEAWEFWKWPWTVRWKRIFQLTR